MYMNQYKSITAIAMHIYLFQEVAYRYTTKSNISDKISFEWLIILDSIHLIQYVHLHQKGIIVTSINRTICIFCDYNRYCGYCSCKQSLCLSAMERVGRV